MLAVKLSNLVWTASWLRLKLAMVKLIPEILNVAAVILAVVATVMVFRRLRGSSLALWLLVIWFLPLIGPIVALAKSSEKA